MSLVSQITALAARIADEFNAVRSEISEIGGGGLETGTSFPASPTTGQLFLRTDTQSVYAYGGTDWILLSNNPIDGGTA